jgi:hypothetical protein
VTAAPTGGDFLVHAVGGTSGNPVLERIRDKGSEVVLAIYRLAKTSLVHALDNQAITASVHATARTLRDFAAVVGGTVVLTYVGDTVFVCGQLLRASRGTYESAIELGGLLARAGASELTFEGSVPPESLLAFAGGFAASLRDPSRRGALLQTPLVGMTVRRTDPTLERDDREADATPGDKVVRLYASALAVMNRFLDSLATGSTLLPHRVKRLAQSLVSVSETGHPALIGMTALAHAHRDDAGRAVQSALLALVVARQITTERVPLARIAMAALLADAGRVRLAGESGRDRLVGLPDALDAQVPGLTSATCITMAGVNIANAARTVMAHEATWLERQDTLGPVYAGELSPLFESRILETVRAMLTRLAPRDASRPMSPLEALADLARSPSLDPVAFRLLVRAVGVIPIGTVVELDGGEWAVVAGTSETSSLLDRPRVRVVVDRSGRALDPPVDVDLGALEGPRARRIVRVLEPGEAQFNVARVLIG